MTNSTAVVYPDIASNATATSAGQFTIQIANDIPDQHIIFFELEVTDDVSTYNSIQSITVNAPILSIGGLSVDDSVSGNSDAILDPGETADIILQISNLGNADVTNVLAGISSSSSDIVINTATAVAAPLGVGETDYFILNVTANADAVIGTSVPISSTVTAGVYNQYTEADDFNIVIGFVPDYCDAGGVDTGYLYIQRVQLNDIDNFSSRSSYTDYTSITTDLLQDESYAIVMTNGDSYDGTQMGCWIDWNYDGDFDDADEEIMINYQHDYPTSGIGTGTGIVSVPADARLGPTTMRLRVMYTGSLNPCGPSDYGEVEDYTIHVDINTCPSPNDFTMSNISPDTVDLSWTQGGSETNWEIEYGLSGFDLGTGSSIDLTNTTYTLYGLNPASEYDVYIRSNCGAVPGDNDSIWVGPVTFTTLCGIITPPWSYDVEAQLGTSMSVIENCWSSSPQNTTSYFRWNATASGSTPSSGTGPSAAHSGTHYFYTEASTGYSGHVAELLTPTIDISSMGIPQLSFYYHMYGSSMGSLHIDVYNEGVWHDDEFVISGQQQISGTDSWLEQTVLLTAYTGNIQIRFRGIRGENYYGDMAIDDISFEEGPTCPTPTDFITDAVSYNTVDLSWTPGFVESNWEIEYGLTGFTQGAGTILPTTTNTAALSGLSIGTAYDIYVRANCGATPGDDDSEWVGPLTFSTIGISAPNNLTADTNQLTGDVVLNWDIGADFATDDFINYNVYRDDVLIGTTTETTYTETLSTYGIYNYYVTTLFDEGESDASNIVEVEYEGVPNIAVNPDSLTEVLQEGGSSIQTITISNSGDGALDFAISALDIDYSAILGLPSEGITELSTNDSSFPIVLSESRNSIDDDSDSNVLIFRDNLAWGYNVNVPLLEAMGAVVSLAGSSEMNAIDLTPYDLIIFESQQTTSFYNTYQTNISRFENYLNAGGVIEFHCATYSSTRISNLQFPGGLQTLSAADVNNNNYIVNFSHPIVAGLTNPLSGNNASHESFENLPSGAIIITENESGSPTTVEYSYGAGNIIVTGMTWEFATANNWNFEDMLPNAFTYSLEILTSFWLSTNPISGTVPSGSSLDVDVYFDATSLTAGVYNANLDISSNDLDEPVVTVPVELTVIPPSCPVPTDFSADNVTADAVDLSWLLGSDETQWQIEYGTSGFTLGTGTLIDITTNSHTVTGLSAVTDYEVYLRANCGDAPGDDDSLWVGPIYFTTLCGGVVPPWSYDVESQAGTIISVLENCWSSIPTNTSSVYRWNVTTSGSTPSSSTGPSTAHSGTHFFYTEASEGSAEQTAELLTPTIDISSLTVPQLSFYYHMYGSDMGSLHIDVYSEGVWHDDELVISGQQQSSGTDPWLEQTVMLTAFTGNIQIRFRGIRGSSYHSDIAIDDISFEEGPTCPIPVDFTVDAVSYNTADLSWTAGHVESNWEIEYGLAGFTQGTGTELATTTNAVALNTLNIDTAYHAYVRANCGVAPGDDDSDWVGPLEFSTLGIYAPSNLIADINQLTGEVALNWGEGTSGIDEDFSDGEANNWVPVTGDWNVSGGLYNVSTSGYVSSSSYYNEDFSNFELEVKMRKTAGSDCNMTINFNADPNSIDSSGYWENGYKLLYCTTNGVWILSKMESGTWTNIYDWEVSPDLNTGIGSWNVIKVAFANGYIDVFFNGVSQGSFYDDVFTNGKVGITMGDGGSSGTAEFDYVSLTNLTEGYEFGTVNQNEYRNVYAAGCADYTALSEADIIDTVLSPIPTHGANYTYATDDFINYNVYRDDTLIGTTIETNYTDMLSTYGVYNYYVSTLLDEGESEPSNIETVTWYTCPMPTDFIADNITADSVDLSWLLGGDEVQWQIEYGATGFTLGLGTLVDVNTNPYTLTSLSAVMDYDVFLRANCGATPGDDDSLWVGPISFTTPCGIVVSPWSYDVESQPGTTMSVIENCWSSTPNNTSGAYRWNASNSGDTPSSTTGPSTAHSGTHFFYTEASEGYAGHTAELLTPTIDISSLASPQLSFYYHMYGSDIGSLHIDVYSEGVWHDDELVISGQQQTSGADPWLDQTVLLTAFTGNIQIRFRGFRGSSYHGDIAIDDISFEEAPSCPKPSNFTVDAFTHDSADLSWIPGDAESNWEIEYGTEGFTQGTGIIASSTINSITLDALNSSTTYDLYLRANCGAGDDSVWVGPLLVTTNPDFCNGDHFYDSGGASGNYSNSENTITVITPSTSSEVIVLTFNSFYLESCCDYLKIYDGPDITAPLLGSFNGSTNPGTFTSTDVSGALTVWFTSDGSVTHTGWDASVFCNSISCPMPTNLMADNILANSANLSWQLGGDETQWQIEYGTAGFSLGSGTLVDVATNSYSLAGLSISTDYDVYVRAVCGAVSGDDDSAWIGPTTFATLCGVVSNPWIYNVESHSGTVISVVEDCWTSAPTNTEVYFRWNATTNGETPSSNTGPNSAHSGSRYFYAEASSGNAGDTAALMTPLFDVSSFGMPQLSFYYHMYGSSMGSLHVDVYNEGVWHNDELVISGQQQTSAYDAWLEQTLLLTDYSGSIQIRFRGLRGSDYHGDIAIDDISIVEALSTGNISVKGLRYYPNPVDESLYIAADEDIEMIEVYTVLGQCISINQYENVESVQIDTSSWSDGTYFIVIYSNKNKDEIKIVKQ